MLSVLTAAQHPADVHTTLAAPCPLRGMRTAVVVSPGDPAAVHAAAVSLTMAATKVSDHALDGDGLAGRVPRLATAVSRRWAGQGDDLASLVDFDTQVVRDAVIRSNEREGRPGLSFDDYVEPTEDAAAAACRHTAVMARRLHNADALDELGRMFGRITYLFDAVDDEADDLLSGHFNALVECYPSVDQRRREARALFEDAYARLVAAFERLELCRPDLARALLVEQLKRAGHQRFHHVATCSTGLHRQPSVDHRPNSRPPARPVRALAEVGLTAVAAFGLALAVFRPENPPGGGQFDPNAMNAGGFPSQFAQDPGDPGKSHWWNRCDCDCDGADCCTCACCCDSCDCCDCGDW